MSHCAPEATLNSIRLLKFTPETVVSMSSSCKCAGRLLQTRGPAAAKLLCCVVCACNGARSVGGRAEPASRTFRDQVYVVGQVWRCLAGQRREDKTCQFSLSYSQVFYMVHIVWLVFFLFSFSVPFMVHKDVYILVVTQWKCEYF